MFLWLLPSAALKYTHSISRLECRALDVLLRWVPVRNE
jgi:hypothetical protein